LRHANRLCKRDGFGSWVESGLAGGFLFLSSSCCNGSFCLDGSFVPGLMIWMAGEVSLITGGSRGNGAIVRTSRRGCGFQLSHKSGCGRTPDEIAGPILFAARGLATFMTGEVINVNGGAVLCG
jgi:hypothetical protein